MKKRTRWLPLLAVAAGVLLLVPTTLAQPAPGTTLYAVLGANRFPGAANTAVGTLRFVSDTQVTLEVKVTGTDVRAWTPRVYSRGNCSQVLNWVGTRGTDGLPLHPVLTNGADAPQALFGADVARIHAALERGERLALMLAGAGSGGATTQSPYRTCTNFGTTPPVTTSTTTSSATATSATTTRTTTATTTSIATTSIATTSIATTSIATTTPPAGSPPRVSPLVALVTPEDSPLPITLAATDPDGDAVTFAILAGPGHGSLGPISSPVCPAGVPRTCSASVRYTPDPDYTGPDQFVYAASDATSGSNPGFVLIRVSPVNDAPVAVNDGYTTAEDSPLVVPAPGVLANDTDVDGDPLTAMLVAGPANGTLVLNPDGSFSYTPNANFNGTDSFTYRASDGSLGSNTATVTLTVTPVNDPPVAVFDSYTTAEDSPLTVPAPGVLANDSDVDGDPLAAIQVFAPLNGTLVLNPNGSFTYTPNANFNGTGSFNYRASDGTDQQSNVAMVSITVTPVNDPPVAIANSFSLSEDSSLTVAAPGVLGNDSDVEGSPPLTAVLVTGPAHAASFTLGADGRFSYAPSANFNGTDTFTYRASDGTGLSNVATVTLVVTPINDAPVAVADSYTHHEDSPLTIPAPGVLANDTDVDGDRIAASLVDGPAHALAFTLNADGSFTYTPSAFNGTDSFIYQARDGVLNSNFATVSITVTPPAADLVVTVTHVPAAVNAGAIITYFITITNLGPSTANATAALVVELNSVEVMNSGLPTISLPPGASAQFTLNYAVPSNATGTIVATATVTSPISDSNLLNNTNIDTNSIVPQP